jgi:hypothetical protein
VTENFQRAAEFKVSIFSLKLVFFYAPIFKKGGHIDLPMLARMYFRPSVRTLQKVCVTRSTETTWATVMKLHSYVDHHELCTFYFLITSPEIF